MHRRAFLALCLFAVSPLTAATQKMKLRDIPDDTAKKKRKKSSEDDITPEERMRLVNQVADGYFDSGVKAMDEGRLAEAESLFERVLVLQPSNAFARRRLDTIRAKREPKPTPKPSTPAKDPATKLTRRWDAELTDLIKLHQWDRAETVAKNILAVDPENGAVRAQLKVIDSRLYDQAYARGSEREKAGDLNGAIDAFQVAIAHNPNAKLLDRISHLQERIADDNRKKSDALYLDALKDSQNGKTDEATSLCRQALKLNPNNLQARRMIDRLSTRP